MNEECITCGYLREQGKSEDEVKKAHEDCHGWYHCGDECCGGCPYCEVEYQAPL